MLWLRVKNMDCGLSRWFEGRSQDQFSWSADPVNRTWSIQHLTQFIIHKGTLVLVGCRLELQSNPESDIHHQGVWVNILSEDQHYLLIWLFVPEPQIQYNMSPTMSSESKLPGSVLCYMFSTFTGKTGPGDNKKGNIYRSPRACDISASRH